MDLNILHRQIQSFLAEDIGRGDLTSESIFSPSETGRASLVAREACIVAGCETIAVEVFKVQNPAIHAEIHLADGASALSGQALLTVDGPVIDLLKAERIALNLMQRLSGIASFTRQFVDLVSGTKARITDTRKTTPGLRMFEKYAVTVGGGFNHRFNLTDGVLIKDNHIAACGSIAKAVEKVRRKIPHTIKIEVETENLQQVEESLACKADIIMLDNMPTEMMTKAVAMINGRALVEASGGVNLTTVAAIAACGVDIISIGALTHSARSCDIGMDWLPSK